MAFRFKITFIALFLFFETSVLSAQNLRFNFTPQIGDTIPNYIFSDLYNYSNKSIEINSLRGKWLVLDFWSKDCLGCLRSLPKMDRLREKFQDNLNIIMIGNIDSYNLASGIIEREKPTKILYDKLAKLYNLNLIVAFDSILTKNFGLRELPYILVIDPQGYIRGITTLVNEGIIKSFLEGGKPELVRAYTGNELTRFEEQFAKASEPSIEEHKSRYSDSDLLHLSELTLHSREKTRNKGSIDFKNPNLETTKRAIEKGVIECTGTRLHSLFYIAFFGVTNWQGYDSFYHRNFSKDIIVETNDSLYSLEPINTLYNYRLYNSLSNGDIEILRLDMQKDLEKYFSYKGTVSKRQMPVYYLVISDKSKFLKLKSNGDNAHYIYDSSIPKGFQMILNNANLDELCDLISTASAASKPVLNMTGSNLKIDIDLRAYIQDISQINLALNQYGLGLQESKHELNTISLKLTN